MNETYVTYLKAKVEELKAQVKLQTDAVYFRDARIRTLLAENEYLNDQLRTQNDRCLSSGSIPDHVSE